MQLQRSVRIGLPRAVGVPRRPAGRVSSTYRRVEPSASPRGRRVLIRDRFTSTQGVTSAQRCVLFQGVDFFNVHNFYNNGILIRTVSAFSRRVFSSRVTTTFVWFTLLLLSFSLQHHVWRLSSLLSPRCCLTASLFSRVLLSASKRPKPVHYSLSTTVGARLRRGPPVAEPGPGYLHFRIASAG